MIKPKNVKTHLFHPPSLGKQMFRGAAIALLLILLFLFSAGKPEPEWPTFWMVQPLIIVPLAGALGGAFYYFMDHLSSRGRLNKTLAVILSLIVFILGLWMGTVLGLNGTMWN